MTTGSLLSAAHLAERPPVPSRADAGQVRHSPTSLTVFTLVLWITWLSVGVVGARWARRPQAYAPPAPEPPPIQAQRIEVQVEEQPSAPAPSDQPDRPAEDPPPDREPPADVPPVPPLPAVAAPSPSIAFSVPVEGPVRLVAPAQAGPALAHPPAPAPPAVTTVRHLTYGQGEGRQPAPDYPPEAVAAHEEGVVGVRLKVGPDGSVLTAHVASPSRWPLLNRAAVEAVRERWHFRNLAPGLYEVSIRFQLEPS